jgi:hypothetical protein
MPNGKELDFRAALQQYSPHLGFPLKSPLSGEAKCKENKRAIGRIKSCKLTI